MKHRLNEENIVTEKKKKSALFIVFVTVFIDLLGFGIVLPLLPRYGRHFEASGLTLGLLMASFSAMQFLFAPLWGQLSDRIGRRPVLIVGLVGSTISYLLFGVATSLGREGTMLGLSAMTWLFITRIGAGIAGATISTAQAVIADSTGPEQRAKGMALIGAAFGIGFTFGPLLGAAFVSAQADSAPSAAPGYVAAALSGIALLMAIFVLPESLKPDSAPAGRSWLNFGQLANAVKRPAIGIILFAIFLTTFAFAQFESTLSLLTDRLGMADRQNFYVFAYIGLVLTLSQGFLVRRLVPKLGEYRMALAGAILMTVGLALLGVVAMRGSRSLLYTVLPVSVIGFSALTPSLQSLLSRGSSESDQGGILGVGQSLSALARILGPMLGLTLEEVGSTLPYWSGAGLMVLGAVLVFLIRGREPDDG